jgi:ABC-2 type transport system permease protein
VSYVVFALYLGIVELFAKPGIAPALVHVPELLAQVIFTPLLVTWSISVSIAISAYSKDPRNAAQLAVLCCLPAVAVTSLIAFNVIPATLPVALAFGAGLVLLDRLGWRVATAIFDRECLITST